MVSCGSAYAVGTVAGAAVLSLGTASLKANAFGGDFHGYGIAVRGIELREEWGSGV